MPRIVRSILFVNGSKMTQFEKYSFYEKGEHVSISSSFELIAEYRAVTRTSMEIIEI